MRTTLAIAATAIMILSTPVFAQSAANAGASTKGRGDVSTRAAPSTEGRAAARDHMSTGGANGNGNALNGPLKAPDATRNNGQ